MSESELGCVKCGADLKFDPGASALTCPYCGAENEIEAASDDVGEQDFHAFLSKKEKEEEVYEVTTAKCTSCGAESTLDENTKSDSCPFCGDHLQAGGDAHRLIKPQSMLPFSVTGDDARKSFRSWLSKLWFAPNKLKKMEKVAESMQGVFLPHWTYDADTTTSYQGQRGEYYYVTESYTTTDSKGNSVRKTRQVRKTRWYHASGRVRNNFDDLLVVASESLPKKYVRELEPWGLDDLVKFDEKFTSGFKTESYAVNLEDGFGEAQEMMVPEIKASIRYDIGGDTQRIWSYNTGYQDITFKHLLLPVWLSCYRYQDKVYRFVVNARTGEVQGERPWSVVKIALAVVAVACVIGGIIFFANQK